MFKSLPKNYTENVDSVTFAWNFDGVPLSKSSKISIWPFYLMVNEIPKKLKHKKENTVVADLWFGSTKPAANLFLSIFENDLQKL